MKLQVARTFTLSLTEDEGKRLCALLGITAPSAGLWDVFSALDGQFSEREASFSDLFEVKESTHCTRVSDDIEIHGKDT